MTAITQESRVRQNEQVVARELSPSEGGVLLHLESAQYHGVNPVGLLIWELLDGQRTVSEVIAAVRDRVVDAPPQLDSDVLQFLVDVHERNLVVVE